MGCPSTRRSGGDTRTQQAEHTVRRAILYAPHPGQSVDFREVIASWMVMDTGNLLAG